MKSSMYIYNIFPRLYRGIDDWIECVKRAKKMGFNTIFVNSFLKCGESNSIYSIADYYSYDDLSFNCKKQDYQNELKRFLNVCKQENMDVLFDLVINHTAIDNELTKSHKSWYKLDEDGNILNPSTPNNEKDNGIEVWKDCAKLDYSYRNYELWTYIVNVCKYYISLGFDGFRCDAATQVPARFWNFLISKLRKDYPSIIFIGETFMCTSEEKLLLAEVGFNYIFNSAKWWNYSEDWLIQQNEETRKYIPSISFPENHDTERLMNEVNGNIEKFKQRLWFTGLFSKGFMITSGFEYGYTKKTHVVYTRQKDKEQTKYDFTSDIAQILNLKSNHKALYEESSIKIVVNNKRYIAIIKEYDDDKVLMLINKTNTSFIINTKIDNILNSSEMLANSKGVIIELKPMEISIYSVLRKKMKAAVLVGKKHLEMQEVPIPLMDENEVTVKVVACGICGSDVHEYNNGPFFWEPTRIGGHEFIV